MEAHSPPAAQQQPPGLPLQMADGRPPAVQQPLQKQQQPQQQRPVGPAAGLLSGLPAPVQQQQSSTATADVIKAMRSQGGLKEVSQQELQRLPSHVSKEQQAALLAGECWLQCLLRALLCLLNIPSHMSNKRKEKKKDSLAECLLHASVMSKEQQAVLLADGACCPASSTPHLRSRSSPGLQAPGVPLRLLVSLAAPVYITLYGEAQSNAGAHTMGVPAAVFQSNTGPQQP